MLKRFLKTVVVLVFLFSFYTYMKNNGGYYESAAQLNEGGAEFDMEGKNQQVEPLRNAIPHADIGGANDDEISGVEDVVQGLEGFLEANLLEEFPFQEEEKAVCIYEIYIDDPLEAYGFPVYKIKANKDIIYIGSIYIAKGTSDIYILTENGAFIKVGLFNKIVLLDESEAKDSLVWLDAAENSKEEEERLSMAGDFLNEKGKDHIKLMYGGFYLFLGREYYVICEISDMNTHIAKVQDYYIDNQSHNVYEKPNDLLGRMELIYIGNLNTKE